MQFMIIHLISFFQVLSSATKLICWIVLTQLMLCRRSPCLVRAEILSHSMMMMMMMMVMMIFIMAIMVCSSISLLCSFSFVLEQMKIQIQIKLSMAINKCWPDLKLSQHQPRPPSGKRGHGSRGSLLLVRPT